MPNNFQLTPKTAKSPAYLDAIDGHMCVHFGVECDPKYWHAHWYDIVGFRLAMGHSFGQIREYLTECLTKYPEEAAQTQHLIDVTDWLEANYTVDAWAEIGRRANG